MALRILVMCSLLTGCFIAPFNHFHTNSGIEGWWGPYGNLGDVDAQLHSCEKLLGIKFHKEGARVYFVSDSNKYCHSAHINIKGCYYSTTDEMYITDSYDLVYGSLCHEFLHRYLYFETGSSDINHNDPLWTVLATNHN